HTTNETIINLTCSVIDNGNLSNITLYADFSGGWAANETVSLSDNYEEVTFNKNLSTGSYKWNCLACDTDNNCDWGNLNYTFKINENISSNNTCEAINASCYYVNKNASGSNNGSDWLDAWEELDQISWASINPGDIIYLAGGDYYTALNIGASGSLGIPLTIKRATTSVHGTNTGWQVSYDSQVVLNSNAYVIINDNSNIVVDGVTNNGFFVSAPNAGLGYPNIVTYGLYLNNINNVLIQNFGVDCANNLYHCRGIHLMYADNITISSSNFNNLVNDGMMISDATNSVFEYNTFGPWLYIPGSCDTTPPDSCHADLLEIRTTQDITFRYNHINWSSDGIHFGILSTSSGRWDIYGNLIYSPVSSFSQAFKMNSVGISAGPIYIYNNVISNYRNPISFDDRVFGEVTNNIFYQDEAVGMGVMNHDYNIYVNSDFITWGATPFVQNTNEIITTIDPFVNGANQDFHLTPFSSAIDSGLDLGSSYNMDLEGNIRPQGNAWDIGAYESNYSSEYILTTLNNPLDSNMTYNKTIVFNCSAISNNDISNITLYTNMSGSWSANETKNISGTSDSTTFTKTLIDGSYAWNCLATNNVSNTSFATSNYSLIINPSYGFNQSSKTININKGSTNSYDLTLLNNNTFAGSLSLNSNSGYVDVPSSIILASYTNTDFTINVSSNTGTLNDVSLTVDITGGNALHQVFLTLISWCGDGNCDSDESCSGCEADCGECSSSPSSYSSSSSSSPTTTTPVLGSTELIQYYFGETHPVMKTETKTSQATTGLFTIINTNPNIPPPPGFVYEIFEVSSGFSSSIIRNTLFTFNVDKSWFDDKDISLEEVSLYLFNTDSEWEEKSTSYVGEGQTTEMYSAETDAIGVFAVAAYIPPPPTPTSSVVTEDEGIGEEIVTEEAKKKFGLTWILIILGSLTILSGVGAGSYFGFKKFKEVRGEKQEELSEEQKRVEIRNFFASEAEMGRKENLSVNLLLQRGYDKTLIRDVYDDYKTEQLVSYVKKLISKGADEKQIVEKLLGVGWSKEKILEILEQANQKTKSDLNVDQVSPEKKP
ncbi:PGF-pre-PGF domain-containing protein, partial [Candidatus Woesearchaeota archaeon]|nr:PGF-pre-PGF domain-containing protein [Candidatus Woesearchaeota archaeon]